MFIWNLWLQGVVRSKNWVHFVKQKLCEFGHFLFSSWKLEHKLKTRVSVVKSDYKILIPYSGLYNLALLFIQRWHIFSKLCFSLFYTGLALTHSTWKRQNPCRRIDKSLGGEKKKLFVFTDIFAYDWDVYDLYHDVHYRHKICFIVKSKT